MNMGLGFIVPLQILPYNAALPPPPMKSDTIGSSHQFNLSATHDDRPCSQILHDHEERRVVCRSILQTPGFATAMNIREAQVHKQTNPLTGAVELF